MNVAILLLNGYWDTGLAVILDAFKLASMLAHTQLEGSPHFKVTVVGMHKSVTSGLGYKIPVQRIAQDLEPDWVVVPAIAAGHPDQLVSTLSLPDTVRAVSQLIQWQESGINMASSCIGSFVLAETGILDYKEATTTWWLAPLFRKRYPKVCLDESKMLVPSDGVTTAGAAMGHLDLALWLIRQASPDLALMVSRYLLADFRSSQATYIIPNHLAHADPLVQQFERWARTRMKEGFSLRDAGDELGVSPRTLQRRCEAVLGKSPLAFVQDLRIERAQSLLHGNNLSLEVIASEVGYNDAATLRTLLREKLGRGVRELRAQLR